MVCESCEKKLSSVICPDVWKDGAKNTIEGGGRKVNENKGIGKKNTSKSTGAMNTFGKICRICKGNLHQPGFYCQRCAYAKGICSMCGKKILDTSSYKQTNI